VRGRTGRAAGAPPGAWWAGVFGGRSPASPGHQKTKWEGPGTWHARSRAATPLRWIRGLVRRAGTATYPKLLAIAARREDG
jgi:hypothetical protein